MPARNARFTLSLVLAALGATLIVSAFVSDGIRQRRQQHDLRGTARLTALLDSTRRALQTAPGADSARLLREVAEREYFLGQRSYHLPLRQQVIDGWWQRSGGGTLLVLLGAVALGLAGVLRARHRETADRES